MKRFGNKNSPIGLDVGTRSIKAVQLSGTGNHLQIIAATELPRRQTEEETIYPSIDELASLVSALQRQGFTGNKVVLSVPESRLISTILELPPRESDAPIDQLARLELANMNQLEPESLEIHTWDLPDGQRKRDQTVLMAAACGHSDADELLDLYEAVGLVPVALDMQSAAIGRACDWRGTSEGQILPIIDLGWKAARLIVVYQGNLIYERPINEAALEPLWHDITNRANMDDEVVEYLISDIGLTPPSQLNNSTAHGEAVVPSNGDWHQLEEIQQSIQEHFHQAISEIQISLSYASHQYSDAEVMGVKLVGGAASIPGLSEFLNLMMGLDIQGVSPMDIAQCPDHLLQLCSGTQMTPAMGLALHGREQL